MVEKIYLAGGCFWCTEAIFLRIIGIENINSGYIGGNIPNPTYNEICAGNTGHAEAVEITFNSSVISLMQLLEIFWTIHNPTTLNKQGADKGTQYRSAIFYTNEEQYKIALNTLDQFARTIWSDPIVTEILPASEFYPAEKYHQNYFDNNPNQYYCQIVINPKLEKARQQFTHLMKKLA